MVLVKQLLHLLYCPKCLIAESMSSLYLPICNYWFIFDNSEPITKPVAEGFKTEIIKIYNQDIYNQIVKP